MAEKEGDVELYAFEKHDDENHVETLLKKKTTFTGLTKQQLMQIEQQETFWRKLRIFLFVLFWLIWFGMLLASIVIIILTPSCPTQQALKPWEKTCIYRLNPFAFSDGNNDNVGDLKGLEEKLPYIKKDLQVNAIILDSILPGVFNEEYLHLSTNFTDIHPSFGTLTQLQKFVSTAKRSDILVIASLDLNGVGVGHSWVTSKPGYFIDGAKVPDTWIARNGLKATCMHSGKSYYTSMGPKPGAGECVQLDLDLTNKDVLAEITEIIKFWLREVNVGGILLTNGAFLVEDFTIPWTVTTPGDAANHAFFTGSSSGQLFHTEGTRTFLEHVRKAVDSTASKKVLLLEAGDTVSGVTKGKPDPMLSYLKTNSSVDLVDVVFLPHFLNRGGWKSVSTEGSLDLEEFVKTTQGLERRIALSTASPYHLRHGSLEAVAGAYLLPGLTVIYMGTELNLTTPSAANVEADTLSKFTFYPKGARSLAYLASKANPFDKDVYLSAAMPWSARGGFSNTTSDADRESYTKFFGSNDVSVEAFSASGAPENTLSLVKKLIQLKKSPSLLWGKTAFLETPELGSGKKRVIFTRESAGFPKFVVVLLSEDATTKKGTVVPLAKACQRAYVRLTYPSNPRLTQDKEISMESVYIDNSQGETLNVFECLL